MLLFTNYLIPSFFSPNTCTYKSDHNSNWSQVRKLHSWFGVHTYTHTYMYIHVLYIRTYILQVYTCTWLYCCCNICSSFWVVSRSNWGLVVGTLTPSPSTPGTVTGFSAEFTHTHTHIHTCTHTHTLAHTHTHTLNSHTLAHTITYTHAHIIINMNIASTNIVVAVFTLRQVHIQHESSPIIAL